MDPPALRALEVRAFDALNALFDQIVMEDGFPALRTYLADKKVLDDAHELLKDRISMTENEMYDAAVGMSTFRLGYE